MKRRPGIPGPEGFTLIEILITMTIGFVVIVLTYRTLHTVVTVSSRVESVLSSSQETMRFLSDFSQRLLASSRADPASKFESDRLEFRIVNRPVPLTVTYTVENDEEGGKRMLCKETQEFFGAECKYAALAGCDDISFSFSDGAEWKGSWDSDKALCAVKLAFSRGGVWTSFPVVLARPSKSLREEHAHE